MILHLSYYMIVLYCPDSASVRTRFCDKDSTTWVSAEQVTTTFDTSVFESMLSVTSKSGSLTEIVTMPLGFNGEGLRLARPTLETRKVVFLYELGIGSLSK
jgi:hypothetical protein